MAEKNDKTELISLIEDTDLDGLLDDALLDYDTPSKPILKPELPPTTPVVPQIDPTEIAELNSMMQGLLGQDLMKEFESFSKELEQNMPDMFNFQGLEGDIFGPGGHNPVPPSANKHTSTEDTIMDLNKNLENAKASQPPGLEEGGEHMLGMVQELMGNLLSRDVLYEPMKELCAQYPKHLDKEDISLEDKQRFSRQLIVMEEVCKEYDTESNNDTQQVKLVRQNRVLKLVQELQELGNPPSELMDTPGLPDLTQMSQFDNNTTCNQQ